MSQMVSNVSRDMKTAIGRVLHLTTMLESRGGLDLSHLPKIKKLHHPSTFTQNALEEIEN